MLSRRTAVLRSRCGQHVHLRSFDLGLVLRLGEGFIDERLPPAAPVSKPKAAVSWSGGKDCCLAMDRCRDRFEIVALLTVMIEDGSRSRSHGFPPDVLDEQANLLGLPRLGVSTSWQNYEESFDQLLRAAGEHGVSQVIFGDVFPDSHRQWAERVCKRRSIEAVEPLWAEETRLLVDEFIGKGGIASIAVARESQLDCRWLGRQITPAVVAELEELGIDPCGERGEFHTLVTWFPGFRERLQVQSKGVLSYGGCSFLDLHVMPQATSALV